MRQSSAQGIVAILGCQITEQLRGVDEQRAMPLHHRMLDNVLCNRGFADAVRSDQHDMNGLFDDVESHQLRIGRFVALRGSRPVEVRQRFEAADMRRAQSALQAALLALLFSLWQNGRVLQRLDRKRSYRAGGRHDECARLHDQMDRVYGRLPGNQVF